MALVCLLAFFGPAGPGIHVGEMSKEEIEQTRYFDAHKPNQRHLLPTCDQIGWMQWCVHVVFRLVKDKRLKS